MIELHEPHRSSPITMQAGLSLGLVLLLIGAAVTYGRQSQRLDSIETELRESRGEVREMRGELRALRELLIQRTMANGSAPP